MGNRIGIIGVYFGKLPNYLNAWLRSCDKNPGIDFLLVTDQQPTGLPENVKLCSMTLTQMQQRANRELGFDAELENPYKCCDYKAIYGLLFKDYVSGYDYWGCCDFDMIFGDLQSFFDQYALDQYDRFLTLGHLCLYRNTEEVNQRYRLSGSVHDYQTVFTTKTICAFDESMGMTKIYQKHGFPMFTKRIFADIATTYRRYRLADIYPLDKKPVNYPYQVFYWEDGKTYRAYYKDGTIQKEEYLYVHFQKRPNYTLSFDCSNANGFYITNKGFFEKTGEVTLEAIKEMNPYPGMLYEKCEELHRWFKEKTAKVKRLCGKVFGSNG